MQSVDYQKAEELLKKYNKEEFHLRHSFTVEAVMKYFAKELGYESEMPFWGEVGLLHDIDFELYPDQHCQKAPSLLSEIDADSDMVRAICSPGY